MFQQGSSDWCIMTTLKKTPENRLSISKTTLITTVLEQNCSVKQCCTYFPFTLRTSNGLHGNTLDFQDYKVNGICRLFPGTWFRRSGKHSWSKTCFICTQTWVIYTPSEGQETSKARIQEFVQGTILSVTQPSTAPRPTESRRNDAKQPRAPQHLPLQTAFIVTQVKSKPWTSQLDLRATDLLVLLVLYL